MRTILALLLLIPVFHAPYAVSAETADEWLDVAANPKLTLREREYAVRQVIMLADSSASILIAALKDGESGGALRRQVAAGILGEIAAGSAEAPLLEAAFGKDYFLAEAAAAALARIYALCDAENLRALYQRGLPEIQPPAMDEPAPEEDDWLVLNLDAARNRGRFRGLIMRGIALKYAGSADPVPQELTKCIWEGLLDADADLRRYAVRATVRTGDSLASAKLAAFLYTENNPGLLIEALRAMVEIRPPDYGEAVERHVAHADPKVSLEALAALDAMGYPGTMFPAAPGMRAVAVYVSHPSTPVRRRAVELLAAGRNPAALEYLVAALSDRVAMNRAAAARALGELGFTGAVGGLNPLLRDSHPEVRSEAAVALSRLGVIGVAAGVLDDLADGTPVFRKAAAVTLGRLGDPRAAGKLLEQLDGDDAELACLAAESLGRLRVRDAGKRLYRFMTDAREEWVADVARKALWEMYQDDPGMSASSWNSWAKRNGVE